MSFFEDSARSITTLQTSPTIAPDIITAGLRPDLFGERSLRPESRTLLIASLALLVLVGFWFRATKLSAEGLSEDELNKLETVADFRAHGLTAKNGEHPFLMKALQTVSVAAAEGWNAHASSESSISIVTALRFPSALFGSLTVILIFLLATELFGREAALISAALWAFDPQAIGFNRIAKEDTFLLFFFLLANLFWLRSQRIAEGEPDKSPQPYYWATAAAYGAMVASKYVPHLFAISVSYNYIFQGLRTIRWRIGRPRYLLMIVIMGAVFLLCSPTILLPETWRQMFAFATYKQVGHDSYEFMGTLYHHRLTDWLNGVPWYFYLVFTAVKLPPLTVVAFVVSLPLLFRRHPLGDGRYFLLFWMLLWLIAFTFVGGKFTRYFTTMLPAVLIGAALGVQFVGRQCAGIFAAARAKLVLRSALAVAVVLSAAWASVTSAPHYRLYTNAFGGREAQAGYYFSHDEFYDAALRRAMVEVAVRAGPGARVASEAPRVAEFYARQAGRFDLLCVSLSDKAALATLVTGDFVISERGRRYFSNDELLSALGRASQPALRIPLGPVPAVDVYTLDQASLAIIAGDLSASH